MGTVEWCSQHGNKLPQYVGLRSIQHLNLLRDHPTTLLLELDYIPNLVQSSQYLVGTTLGSPNCRRFDRCWKLCIRLPHHSRLQLRCGGSLWSKNSIQRYQLWNSWSHSL